MFKIQVYYAFPGVLQSNQGNVNKNNEVIKLLFKVTEKKRKQRVDV